MFWNTLPISLGPMTKKLAVSSGSGAGHNVVCSLPEESVKTCVMYC